MRICVGLRHSWFFLPPNATALSEVRKSTAATTAQILMTRRKPNFNAIANMPPAPPTEDSGLRLRASSEDVVAKERETMLATRIVKPCFGIVPLLLILTVVCVAQAPRPEPVTD